MIWQDNQERYAPFSHPIISEIFGQVSDLAVGWMPSETAQDEKLESDHQGERKSDIILYTNADKLTMY